MRFRSTACVLVLTLSAASARTEPDAADLVPHLSSFGAGGGPTVDADGTCHLLDAARTPSQSNAIAFDCVERGARGTVRLTCELSVLKGGDGGSFLFLDTAAYGARGPAPYLSDVTAPDLRHSFAVGIDVHDPKNEEPFGEWGNYQGLPEREVSLHWNGREIVKRVAEHEFRGGFVDCRVVLRHVVGGAEVTVQLGASKVYDAFFVPGLLPYEMRLAVCAGTRADATTEFDVKSLQFTAGERVPPPRAAKHVEVFNHVLTGGKQTAYEAEVTLPPAEWAFGRVILTLDIHDAGPNWDEWDRNGEISVFDAEGVKRGIVPFITSYRTECHWEVDVTQFRPWLAGKVRFEVAAGTNFYKGRGFMMSVALDFYHGVPELEPYRIVPLWNGTAHYRSDANHFSDFFATVKTPIDAETKAARIFMTTTGHSQVGEFTPSRRTVTFRADADGKDLLLIWFEHVLWKSDCYLNPDRPQFGTWKYSRAGWAPGDVVHPWWIDLTQHMTPGKTAALDYTPSAYRFENDAEKPTEQQLAEASHVVRSYLILYRAPSALRPAPVLQVTTLAGGGAAAKAGVKEGDYLSEYDGKPLASIDDLRNASQAAATAGKEKVIVVVFRGAERMEFEMPPGKLGVGLSEH